MVIPAHLTYLTIIWLLKPQLHFTALFVAAYMFVALLQVSLLLLISHAIVPLLWLCDVDPDTSAIPVMMSCADLLGTSLLAVTFHILQAFNQPNASFKL
jgi:cation transporter-like permease